MKVWTMTIGGVTMRDVIYDVCAMCCYSDDGNWDAGSEPVVWCKNRKGEEFCCHFCRDLFEETLHYD